MSGCEVVEMKRGNLVLWVFQFYLRPLVLPFNFVKFRSLGTRIRSFKQSFKRSLKQQLSNLVFPKEQFSLSIRVSCSQQNSDDSFDQKGRWKKRMCMHWFCMFTSQELTWYGNFWCVPLGVAVRYCLQCEAARAFAGVCCLYKNSACEVLFSFYLCFRNRFILWWRRWVLQILSLFGASNPTCRR